MARPSPDLIPILVEYVHDWGRHTGIAVGLEVDRAAAIERADAVGGELRIESRPGEGTRVGSGCPSAVAVARAIREERMTSPIRATAAYPKGYRGGAFFFRVGSSSGDFRTPGLVRESGQRRGAQT